MTILHIAPEPFFCHTASRPRSLRAQLFWRRTQSRGCMLHVQECKLEADRSSRRTHSPPREGLRDILSHLPQRLFRLPCLDPTGSDSPRQAPPFSRSSRSRSACLTFGSSVTGVGQVVPPATKTSPPFRLKARSECQLRCRWKCSCIDPPTAARAKKDPKAEPSDSISIT